MIQIRKADPSDSNVLWPVGRQALIESHGHSASAVDFEHYLSLNYTGPAIRNELLNSRNLYFLIFYENRLAGFSNIKLNSPSPHIKAVNVCLLDRIYLLKQFYDLKLGRKLLDHNLETAKAANQAGVYLHTWTENKRAIRFYEKAGFKIIGKTEFKISENHSNPNHVMYLEL